MLLAAVCAVAVSAVYAAQPILGEAGRDLGIAPDAYGWLVSVGQFGYLVGLVFLVPLGDLLDRRRLITVHLIVVAVGLGAVATAPEAPMAFAGLATAGLFAVAVQTTVAYAAAVAQPQERGRRLGFVTSGIVVGILGSRLLAGALTELWGWRSVYLVLAALAVVLAIASRILLPVDVRSSAGRYQDLLRDGLRSFADPVFLSRGVIAFFLFASFGTLWSGIALPLSAAPWRLSETQVGLFGLAALAGALAAGRAGRWADAGRGNAVTGIALAALMVSWVLLGQLRWTLLLPVLGVIVLDFAVQAVHVSNQHILTELRPGRISTAIGGYMVFYSLGSAVGAAATTGIYSAVGWAGSAVLGIAFAGAALLTWAIGVPVVRALRPGD